MKFQLLLIFTLCASFCLNAQTDEQRTKMLEVSSPLMLSDVRQKALQNLQANLSYAQANGLQVVEQMSDGRIRVINRITPDGQVLYYITDNVTSAASISTDEVHVGGASGLALDGDGYIIAEWDGGSIRSTHQDLTGRVTNYDAGATINFHATHVCGTLIGSGAGNASARGMSYAASVDGWDFNGDDAEMAAEASGTGPGNGPYLVSNHSYGTIAGWFFDGTDWSWRGTSTISTTEDYLFGIYDAAAVSYDNIANSAPYYLIFKSAGNDRGDRDPAAGAGDPPADGTGATPGDGYDCISTNGNAKNIMTIGAVNDVPGGYAQPSDVTMSTFSGWGPTDDGRIKPDIVANGVGLNSTYDGSDTDYNSISGTSMSSPSAAGSAMLLQEHYSETHANNMMFAATLKALIIHTADECGTNPGPDYSFGWGLMNTQKAAELITDDVTDEKIFEETLTDGSTYTKTLCVIGDQPLKATMVWSDVTGAATPYDLGSSLDNTTSKLVNDLDIRISKDGTTWMPYILDPAVPSAAATTGDNVRDNVEQIYIAAPGPGEYTISINHKNSLSGGSQNFCLIVSGTSEVRDYDAASLILNGISDDFCGSSVAYPKFSIQNLSCPNALTSATINYRLNGGTTISFPWSGNLTMGQTEVISLGDLVLSAGNGQTFEVWVTLPNGQADQQISNDLLTKTFNVATYAGGGATSLPVSENFDSGTLPTGWGIDNPDANFTWEFFNTNCAATYGTSLYVDDYSNNAPGQEDAITIPDLDLSDFTAETVTLDFDLAYAPWGSGNFEGLRIEAVNACSNANTTVWERSGLGLSTNGGGGLGTGSYVGDPVFAPACGDWASVSVDLSAYIGQVISLNIVNINGWGQPLHIDNINISSTSCPSAATITSSLVSCPGTVLTSAAAPAGFTYQWFKDGLPLVDAKNQNYTTTSTGDYQVIYVGPCCIPLSNTISVIDDEMPTITCPSNESVEMDLNCSASVPDFLAGASASDNCTATANLVWSQSPLAASAISGPGEFPITLSVQDVAGNVNTCQVMLEVCLPATITLTESSDLDMIENGQIAAFWQSYFNCPNVSLTNFTATDPSVIDPANAVADISMELTPSGGSTYTCVTTIYFNGVLAADWLAFTAKLTEQKTVALNWKTANEQNGGLFYIERSVDGRFFEKIGEAIGKGQNNSSNVYSSIDSAPQSGLNYYRIQQIDFTGEVSYSNIEIVQLRKGSILVYPNPVSQEMNIEYDLQKDVPVQLKIWNSLGQLVHQSVPTQQTTGSQRLTYSFPDSYTEGLYFVQLVIGMDESQIVKLSLHR